MKKPNRRYEPHLTLRQISLQPGIEWTPPWASWTLIQVSEGVGYCLQPDFNQDLENGSVILVNGEMPGVIRASSISPLVLRAFTVMPTRLTGLLTLSEQSFFQAAATRKELTVKILPPQHPVAAGMKEMCAGGASAGLLFRLKLFQVFVDFFSKDLEQPAPSAASTDARERLRVFLDETPSCELLDMNFKEL